MYSLPATAVLLFVAAALATPSGIGGGLLFVPILQVFFGLDPKEAAALSQALIAGASIASLGFSVLDRVPVARKYVYLFLPAIIAGSTVGVLVARMLPAFLQLALLVVICLAASVTIFRRGRRIWTKENEVLAAERAASVQATAGLSPVPHDPGTQPGTSSSRVAYTKMTVYVVVLMAVNITFVFFRGSASLASIIGVQFCSAQYWIIYGVQLGLFVCIALVVATKQGRGFGLVVLVLVTGTLGTISGIGGGIVLNPVMLEQGVSPKETSATAIVIITVMSITAAIDYTVAGLIDPRWHLALAADTFLGSVLGMTLVAYIIRKTGRQSVIVFSLGALVVVGGVLALVLGIRDLVNDLKSGRNPLQFHSPCSIG